MVGYTKKWIDEKVTEEFVKEMLDEVAQDRLLFNLKNYFKREMQFSLRPEDISPNKDEFPNVSYKADRVIVRGINLLISLGWDISNKLDRLEKEIKENGR